MKKFFVALLTALCALCTALSFSACKDDTQSNNPSGWGIEYTVHTAYAKAVEMGYDKTLEEFISAISGKDGVDGKDGKDGSDGLGIEDVKFDSDGNLIVTFTDKSAKNLGKITVCRHKWSEWETQKNATCTSIGYKSRVCTNCSYKEYDFIEEAGHFWDSGREYSEFTVKTCTVCSATRVVANDLPEPDDGTGEEELPDSNSMQFVLPVQNAEITETYEFHYDVTLDRYCVHTGIDFGCEAGTSVCAVYDGTIIEIVSDSPIGENYVTIMHVNSITTIYKYITCAEGLKVGDTVQCGDIIGTVAPANGMEMKQGDHLHFEMKVNGKTVDPAVYLDI